MTTRYLFTQLLCLLCLCSLSSCVFAQIYAIELQHRSSKALIRAIMPLMPENTKIQSFDNKLIFNTTPENYTAIKKIIDTLDVATVQLRIKLYNGNIAPSHSASIADLHYELGTSSLEKDNRYVLSTSRQNNRKTDELLVMSGEVAILETQVTLPLLNRQYAYSDKSTSSNIYNENLNSQFTKNAFTLPASAGVNIQIPTPAQLQPGSTIINVQDPVTTNLPINIPVVAGQNFEVENQQSLTQAQANENYLYQADRGGTDQLYQYHQLNNGLMIRPIYMKGSQKVLLEFLTKMTRAEQPNQMNEKAYSQFKIGSTMMLPMNRWVYIGGNRIDKPDARSYQHRTQARGKQNQHLWAYIELSQ